MDTNDSGFKTLIKVEHQDDGMVLAGSSTETGVDTWPELITEFAKMLNGFPDDYRYYINLEILEEYVEKAARAQTKDLLEKLANNKT